MSKNKKIVWSNKGWAFLPMVFALLFIDQMSKITVSIILSYNDPIIINNFFNLLLIHNYGAAFSFLADAGGWQKYFLIVVVSIVSFVLLIWLISLNTKESKLLAYSLTFILAGALGNLLDRSIYGFVVDFLDFHWNTYHWPVFNLADIFISIGAFLLIIDSWKSSKKKHE